MFSDEAHFHLDAAVNRHNRCYRHKRILIGHWKKSFIHRAPLFKHLSGRVESLGLYFFDDCINSERYLALLQNAFSPKNLGTCNGKRHNFHARWRTSTLETTGSRVAQRNSSPSVGGTRISQYAMTNASARPDPMWLFHVRILQVKGVQDQTIDNPRLEELKPSRSFPRNNAGNVSESYRKLSAHVYGTNSKWRLLRRGA